MKIICFVIATAFNSSTGKAKTRNIKKAKVVEKACFSSEQIKTYKAAANNTEEGVPGTMPFCKSFFSTLEAMLKVKPALPLLGAVNISAEYQKIADIESDKDYKLLTIVSELKDGEKGLEIYISITLLDEWVKVWEGMIMTLIPKKSRKRGPRKELPKWDEFEVKKFTVKSSPTVTRNWARMTEDYNFIHLHNIPAKLFGQKGQICHGMWSMAQSLSAVEATLGRSVQEARVEWKKPFYCGTKAEGVYHIVEQKGEMRLMVKDRKTNLYTMPHMVGCFKLE